MIAENLAKIKAQLPIGVELVAVSKFHPTEDLLQAYHAGQRIFGESRPAEMTLKADSMPKDIKWHFIGHLQTNKVRMIVPYVDLIHSVDSMKLAKVISQEAQVIGRKIDVLLEIFVATESTKQGFTPNQLLELLENRAFDELDGINIVGLMAMASLTDDKQLIETEFRTIAQLFQKISTQYLPMKEISMGMSSDYSLAIEQGSTMVRIGSLIFGNRKY